jgi:hypothetical protein
MGAEPGVALHRIGARPRLKTATLFPIWGYEVSAPSYHTVAVPPTQPNETEGNPGGNRGIVVRASSDHIRGTADQAPAIPRGVFRVL